MYKRGFWGYVTNRTRFQLTEKREMIAVAFCVMSSLTAWVSALAQLEEMDFVGCVVVLLRRPLYIYRGVWWSKGESSASPLPPLPDE